MVLQEGRVLVAITVATAHPEHAGHPESRDQWDPRDPRDLMALEVKEVLEDLKDQPVRVGLETLVLVLTTRKTAAEGTWEHLMTYTLMKGR